ncbi:GH25 family lysozyme [Micromonospora sp. NPDC050397]|uniref:GH25 family lysozyme n=1 Tax=Micromonospora sp. NPDC050397 TaxID=3364279 RepID=UPI00384C1E13
MSRFTRLRRHLIISVTALAATVVGLAPSAPASAAAPPGYAVHGIDVSVYQGTINWASVAGAGTDFAYARASLGSGYTDPTFTANHNGAKSNGLYFGAYHFARPDQSSGRQQADYFLDRARVVNDGRTLPPMLDLEWGPASVPTCFGLSQSEMVTWIDEFLDRVKTRTGRTAMIYTNRNWWNPCVGSTSFGGHPLAHPCYCASPGTLANGWSRFTVWQYTSTGSVPGVSGNVDQDVFNGSMADLQALATGSSPARDFDGDGHADVLARHATNQDLYLYQGNGSGGFAGSRVIGNNWSGFDTIFSPGDFDGDGNSDVLARHATNSDLYLYPGNGSGGFGASRVIGNNWSGFDTILSPGDFDGDGNSDVLARHTTNKDLYLYPGNGTGGFETSRIIGNNWSGFDTVLSPGDFDGDGNTDVLARHATNSDLYLYPGNGSGGFGTSKVIGNNWSGFDAILSAGDFDGDGNTDVLARHTTNKDLYLYPGNGTGGFGTSKVIGNNWSGFDLVF